MARLSSYFRLFGAARRLAAHDALAPAEYRALLPWPARAGSFLLKLTIWSRGDRTKRPGERLADALVALGPSYIKLGQFLATRPDVVGRELANDLGRLQDRLAPFPDSQAREVIEAEFGKKIEELYSAFGPPVAAASIAQVHRATVSDGKGVRDVAVKVLRPGVGARFARDLDTYYLAADLVTRFVPGAQRLKPRAVVDTLAESVRLEMDLRLEAAAASELAERASSDEGFAVPAIDWERTSRLVMTSAWIDGVPLRDNAALDAAGLDRKLIAQRVVQSFLTHALRDGFFHADMHPGNLFALPGNRLVAVDFGIMGRLDAIMRRFMAETLHGFLTRNYRRIAEVHFAVGFVPPHKSVDAFAQALRSIGEGVFGKPAADISMARLLAQLFEVTELFEMPLQPQLVLLQKTMVVVEGVARDLDPGHNIWETARPVLARFMAEAAGPEAALRDAAEGAGAIARFLGHMPEALRKAEQLMDAVGPDGLRLSPDAARMIGAREANASRLTRTGLFMAALALCVLAGIEIFRLLDGAP
ncbi:MAG TPA: 2-polyprenylphenol 6-hydroxylase [Micropepsaceae bacterium]|nr:2-polyprenylphenol 6-hydroxylase [Micropepsaceae bacterium]HRK72160.1 2-polyprenylphenol 6-hydroxylase [Micropepsaceae bacterium]